MSFPSPESSVSSDFRARKQQVLQIAAAKFREAADWVEFFRAVMGVQGVIDSQFPEKKERSLFEKSDEFTDIQRMLAKLRELSATPREPTKVITVRMPVSLHESLSEEAHDKHTSINKLCISKLLQLIDDRLVPSNATWRAAPQSPIQHSHTSPSHAAPTSTPSGGGEPSPVSPTYPRHEQ